MLPEKYVRSKLIEMKKLHLTICLALLLGSFVALAKKESISFKSGSLTLRGTLYMPNGEGPFPAIVFVHGSGPETADNSSYSAKWLAKNGFIALAFDKRGAGESDGSDTDWQRFSFDSLANDVVAAIDYLKTRVDVNTKQIGLFASSQGGWVGARALAMTDDIAYIIMRSVSATTVGADRVFERSARLRSEGISEADIEKSKEMQLVEAKRSEGENDPWVELFNKYRSEPWFQHVYPFKDPLAEPIMSYRKWYASIVDFDPVPYLEESDVPIFWIFGDSTLDKLGPVEQSIEAVKELKRSGKYYTIEQISDEGHNIKETKYRPQLKVWLDEIKK